MDDPLPDLSHPPTEMNRLGLTSRFTAVGFFAVS